MLLEKRLNRRPTNTGLENLGMRKQEERYFDPRSDSFTFDFREIKESIDFRYKRALSLAYSALFSLRFLIYLSASIRIAST